VVHLVASQRHKVSIEFPMQPSCTRGRHPSSRYKRKTGTAEPGELQLPNDARSFDNGQRTLTGVVLALKRVVQEQHRLSSRPWIKSHPASP